MKELNRKPNGTFPRLTLHKGNKKLCGKCRKWKPFQDFHKAKKAWDGLSCHCKTCRDQDYEQRRNKVLAQHRQRLYGLTNEQFQARHKKQKGRCAICRKSETATSRRGRKRSLCVDHNHKTKVLRKLLCRRCNWLIGLANEDIELLQKCVRYIQGMS